MEITKKITVAGFGGQGVMMIGQMIAHAANEEGLNTLWYPSYGPETRGGTANCTVTVSTSLINSPVFSKADTLIIMNKPSLEKFIEKVVDGGEIIYNSSLIDEVVRLDNIRSYPVPANDLAMELGNIRVSNMIILGAYLALNKELSLKVIHQVLEKILGEKKRNLLALNIKALDAGINYINEMVK